MKKPFSIVIAEDHTILREGLKSLLSSHADLKVVGEAADGLEAIRCAQIHSPDLILLDLSMSRMTGLDATLHKTEGYILATLKEGADGYVLKEAHSAELLTAIRHVLDGHQYLSPSISGSVIDRLLEGEKPCAIRSAWETLTRREREILKLIGEGYTNKEIADLLCISVKTAEKHRANLMEKLDLHNVASLTALAAEKGLINR
jgi:DNA-binding NarL/FixJ family response regulator